MSRFAEKWGRQAVKEKRLEELKGLLLGWQMRAEGAVDFNLTDSEKTAVKTAEEAVRKALTALASLKNA
jgi:hypothetical protein